MYNYTQMYCQVKKCRYPITHTSMGHRCGKCGKYGHGAVECGTDAIDGIVNIPLSPLLYCSECGDKQHTEVCHPENMKKKKVYKTLRPKNACLAETHGRDDAIKQAATIIGDQNMAYTVVPSGMGCMFYVRKIDDMFDHWFVHSDDWQDDRTVASLYGFVRGCQYIEPN